MGDMEFPQPTPEHAKLMENAGDWNVESTFYMDPSQPPMKVDAKETIEAFGPFWTSGVYSADMFGHPFQGRSTLGYDPNQKCYVSTWIDTMSSTFFKFTGNFKGDTLEMTGTGWDCQMNCEAQYRTTEEHKSPDERVFEMFVTMPDGNEMKMMTHVYRRAR